MKKINVKTVQSKEKLDDEKSSSTAPSKNPDTNFAYTNDDVELVTKAIIEQNGCRINPKTKRVEKKDSNEPMHNSHTYVLLPLTANAGDEDEDILQELPSTIQECLNNEIETDLNIPIRISIPVRQGIFHWTKIDCIINREEKTATLHCSDPFGSGEIEPQVMKQIEHFCTDEFTLTQKEDQAPKIQGEIEGDRLACGLYTAHALAHGALSPNQQDQELKNQDYKKYWHCQSSSNLQERQKDITLVKSNLPNEFHKFLSEPWTQERYNQIDIECKQLEQQMVANCTESLIKDIDSIEDQNHKQQVIDFISTMIEQKAEWSGYIKLITEVYQSLNLNIETDPIAKHILREDKLSIKSEFSSESLPKIFKHIADHLGIETRGEELPSKNEDITEDSEERKEKLRLGSNKYQSLAETYLKKGDYVNTTALYNFTLAIAKKQEDEDEIKAIEKTLAEIEIKFLHGLLSKESVIETEPNDTDINNILIINQERQKQIKKIRAETTEEINSYSQEIPTQAPYKEKDNSEAKHQLHNQEHSKVQQIYQNCNEKLKDFAKELITQSKKDLEEIEVIVPHNCQYAVIALGSLARNEATPFSDIEFAILTEENIEERLEKEGIPKEQISKEIEKIKEYFRTLTKLINIKVINLGETTTGIQDIKEIKGSSPTQNGFSLDGRAKGSCKTPLGNKHIIKRELEEVEDNKKLTKEEKQQKIKEIKQEEYELIAPPSQMAVFHNQEWFLRNNHFTTALSTVYLLEGSSQAEKLIKEYHQEKDKILDQEVATTSYLDQKDLAILASVSKTVNPLSSKLGDRLKELPTLRKERALLLLQESIAKFELTGGRTQEKGRIFNPKYDSYIMVALPINCLTYFYNIKENNVWDRFEKLFIGTKEEPAPLPIQTSETLNKEGIANLIWMLDKVLQIRLKNYMAKGTQNENMVLLDGYNAKDREELIKKELGISMEEVFEVYYVMLKFHSQVKAFTEQKKGNNEIFLNELYCDDSNFVKGNIYRLFLDYDKSIECYKKTLEIEESKLDKDHPKISTVLNNLGLIYNSKGEYNKAIKYYERALNIRESKLGKDHPDVAATLNNLGLAYNSKGEYNQAIKYYERDLEISEAKLGKDHPSIATTLNNLGLAYNSKGEYNQAIKYYERALEISEAKLGKDHPSTAATLNNLGLAYNSKGEYNQAIKYYERDLEISEAKLGKDHPNVAITLNNLGSAHKAKKERDQAYERSAKEQQMIANCTDSLTKDINSIKDQDYKQQVINFISTIIEQGADDWKEYTQLVVATYQSLSLSIETDPIAKHILREDRVSIKSEFSSKSLPQIFKNIATHLNIETKEEELPTTQDLMSAVKVELIKEAKQKRQKTASPSTSLSSSEAGSLSECHEDTKQR